MELKITKIGNSRGVRIPADVLRQYAFMDAAVMVAGVDGILLRPKQNADEKMSWEETAKAMAAAQEDWSEWDSLAADGLESIPWQMNETAGKKNTYRTSKKKTPRRKT